MSADHKVPIEELHKERVAILREKERIVAHVRELKARKENGQNVTEELLEFTHALHQAEADLAEIKVEIQSRNSKDSFAIRFESALIARQAKMEDGPEKRVMSELLAVLKEIVIK